jgi:hypothetical protein
MMVGVEDRRQVSDQAIITDLDAMIGNDRSASVDENLLAEHKRTILGSAHLDWYSFAAQAQASACDRPTSDKHRVPSIYSYDGRSRTRPAEYGRGPETGRQVTNLKH